MTSAQKGALVLGALLLVLTAFMAPWRYRAYDDTSRTIAAAYRSDTTRARFERVGHTYAPLWSRPDSVALGLRLSAPADGTAPRFYRVEAMELDAGRLALMWGAIVIGTAVVVLLLAPGRERT